MFNPHSSRDAHLRLRQTQRAGQLLPLRSDHVVVLLEGSLQSEQLGRREGRPDPFGFPGERAMEQQVLRTAVLSWTQRGRTLAHHELQGGRGERPKGSTPRPEKWIINKRCF